MNLRCIIYHHQGFGSKYIFSFDTIVLLPVSRYAFFSTLYFIPFKPFGTTMKAKQEQPELNKAWCTVDISVRNNDDERNKKLKY
jgi:hypothetical protein